MTLAQSILWSLIRSAVIATLAMGPLVWVLRQIESRRTLRARQMWLLAAVLPLFVPELLIGFNYRLTASQLSVGSPASVAAAGTETLYALIQLARCLAIGCAVSPLLPRSPVTEESLHSWKLLKTRIPARRWRTGWLRLHVTGPWLRLFVSWSLMALIVFQEFETAALMQIDRHPIAWTVWLFDAHAAFQPLSRSLQMVISPLVCELLLLTPAVWGLMASRRQTFVSDRIRQSTRAGFKTEPDSDGSSGVRFGLETSPTSRLASSVPWKEACCVLSGLILFLVWPLVANIKTTALGLMAMFRDSFLVRQSLSEIFTSIGFAIAASALSMGTASILLDDKRMSSRSIGLLGVFLIPGLLGSLVLSLLLLVFFQAPLLRFLYDTWLPMLLGLAMAVFPKAFAVVLLLKRNSDEAAIHSAKLLQQSISVGVRQISARILWRLRTARWLLGGLVVAHWCFWDVTVASILHSVRLEPVVTRLYNEMHYGRTEALLSLALLSAISPGFVWIVAMSVSRAAAILRR